MVDALVKAGAIRSDSVRRAFLAESRERYVSTVADRSADGVATRRAVGLEEVYRAEAALVTLTDGRGVPISSSSAPSIMAPMLEALDLRPGLRVLEVGAGTGYNAALLSRLVGDGGRVVSVDVDAAIARAARRALASAGRRVRVVAGDGRRGWPPGAPFDRIVVTASADTVHRAWRDQLADGGVIVLPFRFHAGLGPQAVVALRRDGAVLRSTRMIPGGFMALRGPGEPDSPVSAGTQLNAAAASGGSPRTLAWLMGDCLARLSASDQQRLLAIVLGRPERRRTMAGAAAAGLVMFLTLHPRGDTVQLNVAGRYGAGVVGPRGSGFAAVTRRPPAKLAHVEHWGDPRAGARLDSLLAEWASLGRPDLDALRMTAACDGERPAGRPWRRLDTAEAVVTLSWDAGSGR